MIRFELKLFHRSFKFFLLGTYIRVLNRLLFHYVKR